jgi:hypothetical protein
MAAENSQLSWIGILNPVTKIFERNGERLTGAAPFDGSREKAVSAHGHVGP